MCLLVTGWRHDTVCNDCSMQHFWLVACMMWSCCCHGCTVSVASIHNTNHKDQRDTSHTMCFAGTLVPSTAQAALCRLLLEPVTDSGCVECTLTAHSRHSCDGNNYSVPDVSSCQPELTSSALKIPPLNPSAGGAQRSQRPAQAPSGMFAAAAL